MEGNRYFPLGSGSVAASQLNASTSLLGHPQLVILSHKTHADEVLSRNGLQRNIHVVVKNSPFTFTMGVTNGNACKVDFNQIAFEGHLVYDCEGEKEVDFVKVKPVEFKFTPSESGDRLECETRIKVLTSQHEDMLFKVKVLGFHPLTRAELPGMSIVSSPIRVISKPEQLKKNRSATAAPASASSSSTATTPTATGSKKRSITDMLAETVARIEAKQEEQQRLIAKLLQQQNDTAHILEKKQRTEEPVSSSSTPAITNVWDMASLDLNTSASTAQPVAPALQQDDKPLPQFDEAFANLIRAYNSMTAEEKPETIRKLIRNLPPRDIERLSELLDLFWTEGLQKELGTHRATGHDMSFSSALRSDGCSCTECPHKYELERIDEFYKDFLSTGFAAPPPF